ncbi:MAG: AAA family ATPase, partial [Candidatus Bruticola sp.]
MAINNSEATERVIARAGELSRSWKHYYLGVEHFFAAACQLDRSLAEAIADEGVPLSELEEGIANLVPPQDDPPLWDGIPETPRYRSIMKTIVPEEAEAAQALRVEPKHVITAILREGRSVPCRVLLNRGVELLKLRDSIRGVVRQESPKSSGGGGFFNRGADKNMTADGRKFAREHKQLLEYGRDLTELARQKKMDPVVGRNDEVRRVLEVLTRKTKSNPVLVGEAGVGKTAVAYGLAQRLAEGTVPDLLKDHHLIELSLSSLVAGAGHRGDFEKRLQQVIEEVSKDNKIILFIDEIHQIVGAGGSGGMDAGNILKPALARGDLAVMGATTIDEYRRYIEADPALERRFQQVFVSEPSEEDAFEILKGLRERYEQHHHVQFSDEALLAAVKLSVRFLPDRNLPDKAIDLIDEAAARIKTRGNCQGQGMQEVTEEVIAEVVADWTGVPISRIANEEEARLLDMENLLRGRVVGQDHAVAAVASTIRVVRVGFSSPTRPSGVFLFLGPSGVGKTELAKTLAEFLFGSERDMIRLDMSEFHDKHSVARLIGAPPGYVGYEGEGQLTKAVRTKPFCVILLDEVEKAHPDVFDLFLQVFDDGRLTDARGRTVNFTNSIIIMTSNLGSRKALDMASAQMAAAGAALEKATGDEEMGALAKMKDPLADLLPTDQGYVGQLDDMPEVYQAALRGHFRLEFLNRIDEIIIFKTLKREDLQGIVDINLSKCVKRIKESRQVDLHVTKNVINFLLDKGYHPEYGARPLNRAIDTWLTRPFAEYVLRHKVPPNTLIWADMADEGDKVVFSLDNRALSDTFGDESGNSAAGASASAHPRSASGVVATPDSAPNYTSQGSYGQPSGYPQSGGYPQSDGYPQSGGYPQPGGYSQPSSYPQPGGYSQPGSYPQPGGYSQPSGYPQPGGYSQPGGYGQPGGYSQSSGYPQQGGYPPQDAYNQPSVAQNPGQYDVPEGMAADYRHSGSGQRPVGPGANIPRQPMAPSGQRPVGPGANVPRQPMAPGGQRPVGPGAN